MALGPSIVGSPIGGALVDRYDPRRLAIVLYVLQAIPAAIMAILDFTGELPLGWLYALVFAGAVPYSLNCPVISLVGPYTVPEEYRQAALAQSSMMFNLTRLAGAVIGGFMVHWIGIGSALAFNAASYVLVALAVLAGTTLLSEVRPAAEAAEQEQASPQTATSSSALAFVTPGCGRCRRLLRLHRAVEQLMPTVAEEHGMTAAAVGLLIGAIGLGAVLANPIIARPPIRPTDGG